MAKRTTRSRKGEAENEQAIEESSMFEVLQHDTVRRIIGVLLIVVVVVLILAAFHKAGIAGEYIYNGITYILGIGYYLVPIILVLLIRGLFSASDTGSLQSVRMGGAVLFLLSSLGIVGVVSVSHAGVLGSLIAKPMVAGLDTIASLVILAGLVVVSLLLLFDGALWINLFHKLQGMFTRTSSDDELTDEVVDVEEDPVTLDAEATGDDDMPDDDDAEDEDVYGYDAEPETTEEDVRQATPRPASRKPAVEIPSEYNPPPLSLLESDRNKPHAGDTKARANLIRRTLQHFKIPVEMDEIVVGPTVTRYSLKPAEGVKLSKIVALQSNLELALAASPIRIEAPIPGRSLVGIEVPNTSKATVGLAGLLGASEFTEETVPLCVALGKDIAGAAHYANVGKMPHMLVAGTTGSGKSVMIHSLITSLLYRNGPERLRFIMVDPKRVELTLYDDIPHLLTPVITDAKKCIMALKWATKEMERRYDVLQSHKVQEIGSYHGEVLAPALKHVEQLKAKGKDVDDVEVPELMPHMVIFIDELADIMTAYPRELEAVIVRLAQMSRAVGIHLVLSTQRPSVNVITGLIKANIPTRIALKVASLIDSRTILDQPGAEKLLGAGDLLYLSGDMPKPRRIQSPYLTSTEVKKVVEFIIENNGSALSEIDLGGTGEGGSERSVSGGPSFSFEDDADDELDEIYDDVREFIVKERKASTSLIQRRFKVGYGRAARIMDQLETRGIIAGSDGTNRPREVIPGSATENGGHGSDSDQKQTPYEAE